MSAATTASRKRSGKSPQFFYSRAAFEAVSKLQIPRLQSRLSIIDVRISRLPSVTPSLDDFDPRDRREPKKPISTWMAYFNLVRTGFGAGMLGLPLAISQTGIVLGPFLTLLIGIIIIHTHLTLLWSLNEISRQLKIPYISYRYGFRMALLRGPPIFHAMGRCGPTIIATFMVLSQLGICTVFVIFTTDSLRDIMDWQSNKPAILTLLVPYIILQILMKSLNIVSYVSFAGTILNAVGLILVFYHILLEPRGEIISINATALPVLFAVGTLLFNMSAVGVILSLDKALLQPRLMTKPYTGVVTIGIMVPTVVSMIFGILGYWSFGTMEENILRSLPYDDTTAIVAIALYLLAVASIYPIQCYPAISIIIEVIRNHDPNLTPSDATLTVIEFIARPAFVLLTFLICYFVPFQGPFVAFVGNLCTTLLSIVFPAMMEICLRYPNNYGIYNLILIKNVLIIVFSLIAWIFGVILCGYLIYTRILSMQSPNDTEYL